MARKYSIAHVTVLGCPPPEMIYVAAMAGYDYVGMRLIYMGLAGEPNYDLAHLPEMLRATKTAMKETGIHLNDIGLARIHDDVDLKQYEPAFEVSAELGCKHVLSSIWTPNKPFYLEKFAELCDLAAQYGLTVNLEYVTWANVKNLKEALQILQTVNRPNTGVLVDTLHSYRSRVAPEELDAIPREWLHFAHICDAPAEIPTDKESLIYTGREARLYVGEGAIDIAAYINRLPKEIVLSLELPHIARAKQFGYAEHARRCLATAKAYFGY
jgi:sugar phosphate isomerase/epimerase